MIEGTRNRFIRSSDVEGVADALREHMAAKGLAEQTRDRAWARRSQPPVRVLLEEQAAGWLALHQSEEQSDLLAGISRRLGCLTLELLIADLGFGYRLFGRNRVVHIHFLLNSFLLFTVGFIFPTGISHGFLFLGSFV